MNSAASQISMFTDAGARNAEARWLGLTTDHRRLFNALQDGWLRPLGSRAGVLLGIETYAVERDVASAKHPIPVHIKLNIAKLPVLDVVTFRGNQWMSSRFKEFESSDAALYWPGVLPTFAISEILVSSEEERARLTGLARSVSNVTLPEVQVKVGIKPEENFEPAVPPPEIIAKLIVPDNEDAIHGATSMAVWAVPPINPWLDVLTVSLASDRTQLPDLTAKVEAPWWQFPPWTRRPDDLRPSSPQTRLWLAAMEIFQSQLTEDRVRPLELAERIAKAASQFDDSASSDATSAWLQTTRRILRAESTIQLDGWRDCPVGIAIQLVLTRPEPTTFKTWFTDLPNLPPAISWSAAALCGLFHGYKRLDTQFRGNALQRELLSIHALCACFDDVHDVGWLPIPDEKPWWEEDSDEFLLFWGDKEFSRKRKNDRGRWFSADFEDARVMHEAKIVAKKLCWQCLDREIILKDGQITVSGPCKTVSKSKKIRQFDIQGTVRIRLPNNATVEEILDPELFRHLVATEVGLLLGPPTSQTQKIQTEPSKISGLIYVSEIPGLIYKPDFLSENEEKHLVETIDKEDWDSILKRRVQHYGWRYDYKARQIDSSMRLGDLPDWASRIAKRLVSEGLMPNLPDQIIVNEYRGKQGITPHSDSQNFEDGIATISLLESWEMLFRKQHGKDKKYQMLERRSVAIMTGPARYAWTHEIPKRKMEPSGMERGRRISLTFRKVIVPADGGHNHG